MGRADYLRLGDWDSICDACGQKYKASKLKKRWDGLMVCPKDYEERHPQDYVRGIRDDQSTPFSRPEPPNVFSPDICTLNGRSAIPAYALPGCAIPNNIYYDPTITS